MIGPTFSSALYALSIFFYTLGGASVPNAQPLSHLANHTEAPSAQSLVNAFANPKVFQNPRRALYRSAEKYCKMDRYVFDKSMNLASARFRCPHSARVKSILMEHIDNGRGLSYLSYLEVGFSYEEYEDAKSILEKNLGRPSERLADSVGWDYRANKSLNALGNPVFDLTRDKKQRSAQLVVAIEQPDN